MSRVRILTKITFYELTITHDLLDRNITIQHDHKTEAERDYKAFTRGGFHVILRKVVETRYETKRSERILKSQWNGR